MVGTLIISDEWRGYLGLERLGFIHTRINHSRYYVHPDDNRIHTNTIERLWRTLRGFIPKSTRINGIPKKLKIFEITTNMGLKTVGRKFFYLLDAIKRCFR